ncbi:pyridoxamine 5'-phosphate oxidase family protein [Desulfosporosinus sp. PR]|uniref:pyridoxamine 5'-phosphate oxidase family protein n=1 Tax=Candidatus Desulfosporosinus nitrosoreducens TaxID=3401928 RepID=UPI0027F14BA0|nr:pyridoxamine 5'-phosphate oxidase family protein [Desulfosporosinus sp. PR]MDQ7095908.1 pyridoxamine 5'-phosphate oxidase family protein [Desulfosporosinus sp. PR]
MNQVSYTTRNCTDQQKIKTFLGRERTGVLGLVSDTLPYAVPLDYVWHNDSIYFHGMGSGKKEKILSQHPFVCFTVYKELGTVTDPVPCHADTAYMSVMIFGRAEKVTDPDEAAAALQKVLEKFMPNYYTQSLTGTLIEKYRSSMDGNAVSVYRLTPQEITAKENSADLDKLFPMETQ